VPRSWPEALELLSAEPGEPVTFRVAAEREFLARLTGAGVAAGEAVLLIAREWAILAGENAARGVVRHGAQAQWSAPRCREVAEGQITDRCMSRLEAGGGRPDP
jgi:hypothetical protein